MKQTEKWAQALAQDLEVIANALRAGSSFMQALQVAAQEGEGPLATEWTQVVQDVQRGKSLSQALEQLEKRCPNPSIASFASIVTVLHETGGNIAGALLTLSESLHQEIAFQNKLRAMTAQGRLSGYVVGAMPFLIMLSLGYLAPELMEPLFRTPTGWAMLAGVVVMITIGTAIIQKIVSIDV